MDTVKVIAEVTTHLKIMRRLIIFVLVSLLTAIIVTSCSATRKSQDQLRGLMLQDNLQMKRNKAYYSKHNIKTKKAAYKRYKRYNRY